MGLWKSAPTFASQCATSFPVIPVCNNSSNNNFISIALFHVRHAQLH